MFVRLFKTAPIAVLATAAAAWAFAGNSALAYAQCGCCQHGGSHADHDPGSAGHQHSDAPGDHAGHSQPAPHGGQLATAKPLTFEVVYQPQEIRVYLYGVMPSPESAKDVTGEVSLQRPYDGRATRVALRYVAQPAGQQDYLAAPVDLSRVKDGELTATVKLANLPLQNRPEITFAQAIVVSKLKPQVALAALDQSDQAGIARQRVCPVTGAALDSMGGPIKVLVGGQLLYLCCKGCLGKVQSAPEAYLRKASQASQVQ
jgi:YHS domain-containing protein